MDNPYDRFHSAYREKSSIRFNWTIKGKLIGEAEAEQHSGCNIGDWFDGGQAAVEHAESAVTAKDADDILSQAYLGEDKDGLGLHWEIDAFFPGRLS